MAIKKALSLEDRKKAQKKLMMGGALVLCLLLLNFAYQWWRYEHKSSAPPPALRQVLCDLHKGPCSVKFSNHRQVTLQIEPTNIPLEQPLTFSVTLSKLSPKKVSMYLVPLNGQKHRTHRLTTNKNGTTYTATTVLPKQKETEQHWMVMVVLETSNQSMGIPFKFKTS